MSCFDLYLKGNIFVIVIVFSFVAIYFIKINLLFKSLSGLNERRSTNLFGLGANEHIQRRFVWAEAPFC